MNGSFFKVPRIDEPTYRAWVRTLPCSVKRCHHTSEAHHRVGHGRCGTVKTDDLECMPLCRIHHAELHDHGWEAFEEKYGAQSAFIVETLIQAHRQGVLPIDRKTAKGIAS